MATIFVDESGSFLPCNGQENFVIGSFTVGDPRRTAKEFKKWQSSKFPRKKRRQSEVKFSESGLSDDLRIRTIKFISSLDVRIRYGYLHCERLPFTSYDQSGLREGYLYTQILGKILESYFPITELIFTVRCDQRRLKGLKQKDFIEILQARLLPIAPANSLIDIRQIDSTSDVNIQIADWIVGALASYLNNKPQGLKYYQILKGNVIGNPIELFKAEQ
ncbi:MAG: DUF3800 domain-containing protein [Patescibacteria group bacterium]